MLFSEVIGQNNIKEKLILLVKRNRLPHALLFSGPEGVGKLATALALAQYVNCHYPNENDSCNFCNSCQKINKLIHPDIHFIFPIYKGTSKISCSFDVINEWRAFLLKSVYFNYLDWNNYITKEKGQAVIYAEEANYIIEKAFLKNYEAKFKFFIIYEAHKMHPAGLNKLLKIIEEPFPNTVFILTTTAQEQLMPTIVSRCQIIKFPNIEFEALKIFLQKNYPNIDEQILNQIIITSEGNLPKCIELIEKGEINKNYLQLFRKMFLCSYQIAKNNPNYYEVDSLVKEILSLSKEQQKDFLKYCLKLVRDNLILNFNLKTGIHLSTEEKNFSEKFKNYVDLKNAEIIYNYLSKAIYSIERNSNPKITFSNLIIKLQACFS